MRRKYFKPEDKMPVDAHGYSLKKKRPYNKAALKYFYGITPEQRAELFRKQAGRCVICNRPAWEKDLDIDHDHKTGKVRGLLCRNCNTGLGMFGDNVEILQNAIEYIKNG